MYSCPCLLLKPSLAKLVRERNNYPQHQTLSLLNEFSSEEPALLLVCVLNGILLLLKSCNASQLALLHAAISYLTLCHSSLFLSQLKAHIHPRRYIHLFPKLLIRHFCRRVHSGQVRNHSLRPPPRVCYSLWHPAKESVSAPPQTL